MRLRGAERERGGGGERKKKKKTEENEKEKKNSSNKTQKILAIRNQVKTMGLHFCSCTYRRRN